MGNKLDKATVRFHLVMFKDDLEFYTKLYGPGGARSEVGVSKALRTIIHQRRLGLEEKMNQKISQLKDAQRDTGDPTLAPASLGDST